MSLNLLSKIDTKTKYRDTEKFVSDGIDQSVAPCQAHPEELFCANYMQYSIQFLINFDMVQLNFELLKHDKR